MMFHLLVFVKLNSNFSPMTSSCIHLSMLMFFNCGDLQQWLDLLSSWAKSWQLHTNISKCSVLSDHYKFESIIPHISLTYLNSRTRLLLLILVYWLIDVYLLTIIWVICSPKQLRKLVSFSVDFHHTILPLLDKYSYNLQSANTWI